MKKIILGLFAVTLAVSGALAQDSTTAKKRMQQEKGFHQGHKRMHRDGLKSLNLTKEQQEKMSSINKEFREGVQELRKQEATITVKEHKEKLKELGKKKHEQFLAVLTPEQKKQLEQKKAERMKKGMAMAEKRQNKMKQELGLTDEQSAKLKTLRADTRQKMVAIRNDKALTDEQRKEQITATFKKQREDMKSVLTPEQQKKLEAMPKPSHRRNFSK